MKTVAEYPAWMEAFFRMKFRPATPSGAVAWSAEDSDVARGVESSFAQGNDVVAC